MNPEVWTIKEIIAWSIPFLKEKGSPTARLDAELMLGQVMGCRRLDLYLDHHKPLSPEERQAFRLNIRRRAAGEPVAYIIGSREFYGLSFEVTSATLIPRPETEHLVERIMQSLDAKRDCLGLDVGTGSGCIALSLLRNQPTWKMEAWDISSAALEIAARNAKHHGFDLDLRNVDALNPESWRNQSRRFDFIVSNPPYIAQDEIPNLPISVVNYEPASALFAEQSGLAFYQCFAKYAGNCLVPGGKIFLEIASHQAADVCLIMSSAGWRSIKVNQDLAGLDRVIEAECPLV